MTRFNAAMTGAVVSGAVAAVIVGIPALVNVGSALIQPVKVSRDISGSVYYVCASQSVGFSGGGRNTLCIDAKGNKELRIHRGILSKSMAEHEIRVDPNGGMWYTALPLFGEGYMGTPDAEHARQLKDEFDRIGAPLEERLASHPAVQEMRKF